MTAPKPGDTVYCTRYALTTGIKARVLKSYNSHWLDGAYAYLAVSSYTAEQRIVGRDVHATPEEAAVAAEKQRTKKIASLKKQIARLEARTFGAPK